MSVIEIQRATVEHHNDGIFLILWHDKGCSIYLIGASALTLFAKDPASSGAMRDLVKGL